MEYLYPAVLSVDEEDPKFINVKFPDIIGAYTFGEGRDDALFMAEDLLRLMVSECQNQVFPPSDINKLKEEYPNDEIVIISCIVED